MDIPFRTFSSRVGQVLYFRFNPCFDGLPFRTPSVVPTSTLQSFNPCFDGLPFRTAAKF